MAKITITTTERQDAALTRLVDRVNTTRAEAAEPLAPVTVEEYVQARITDVLDSYVAQDDQELVLEPIRKKLEAASDAERLQVKAVLGLA